MLYGQIFKIHSDFYYVKSGQDVFECKIREVLKKQKERIFVGDFVEFENGFIVKIIERKNYITRPAVANVDQILIISALKEPDLNFSQLNRYISLAKFYNIDTVLCFNKTDLSVESALKSKILKIYQDLGYKVLFISAKEHKGLNEIKNILEGKISVLCGGSGAGKSSLVNALNPNLNVKISEVSAKTQRGVHTTRHCEILSIDENSKIVDTPGFSNVKFDFILPKDVDSLFDEIYQYKHLCKYSDCLHLDENDCAVLSNIDKIDITRYESYVTFLKEAEVYKDRLKYEGHKLEEFKKISHNKEFVKINEKKRQVSRNTMKQKIYSEFKNE